MKNQILLFAFVLLTFCSWAQNSNHEWTNILQAVDISDYEGKKFKLEADVKMEQEIDNAQAMLWVRIDKRDTTMGFFDNMQDRPVTSPKWKTYTIEGTVDENADKLFFGGICGYNGKFYFDNFVLSVETEKGWKILPIENPSFEETSTEKDVLTGWKGGVVDNDNFTPYAISTTKTEGKNALLIEGKGFINVPELFKKFVGKWKVKNHPSDENPNIVVEKFDYDFSLLRGGNGLEGKQDVIFKVGDNIIESGGTTIISYHEDLKKIYFNNIFSNGAYLFEGRMDENGSITLDRIFSEAHQKAGATYHVTFEWTGEDEITWTEEENYGQGMVKNIYLMKRVDE